MFFVYWDRKSDLHLPQCKCADRQLKAVPSYDVGPVIKLGRQCLHPPSVVTEPNLVVHEFRESVSMLHFVS